MHDGNTRCRAPGANVCTLLQQVIQSLALERHDSRVAMSCVQGHAAAAAAVGAGRFEMA